MESKITYFTRAENDFQFLHFAYNNNRIDDAMAYLSQNICERYLKHVIDVFCRDVDTSNVLRTHSLRVLSKFIKQNMLNFDCDWNKILKCDGYYFSARYPGNDAVEVDKDDIQDCWEAVVETRTSVISFLEKNSIKGDTQQDDNIISSKVVSKLESF